MMDKPPIEMVLRRGDHIVLSPTVNNVIDEMKSIIREKGMEGPPELELIYSVDESRSYQLAIMAAFTSSDQTSWVIVFIPHRLPGASMLLSIDNTNSDMFERRTCVGVISDYLTSRLINDRNILQKAIDWFLQKHEPCPTLKWIPYDDAVRDADN